MYQALKHFHVTCVILSISGFTLRGWWMFSGHRLLNHRFTRTLPHVIDTGLLASAIGLAAMSGQYPLQASWVTAKVVGLIGYIFLGTVALKRGKTRSVRAVAFIAAVLVFSWIVSVALSKNPAGWVALVG
ncbi:SirB2 family protein [Azoarcus sp. L1K30]|uniref:SirB2 family protein n=1 Tax=Azoarcus sp. L1K30 TaxID=2820277 RepID=UPI001B824AB1|nr:SirB2 family protein [Azoarcus sp. L1K30]MBR0564670.1 SirB2 family protein [Azoarcus sp. L1K30]